MSQVEASLGDVQSVEDSASTSRPSVQTASFHQQSSFHATETNNRVNNNSEDATVSADQERQVLLLMLLAQVCALHDPTPKTFTIHVVELYERGLLNRDSINFLFELGLVPSISPAFTNALLQVTRNPVSSQSHRDDASSSGGLLDRSVSDDSRHPVSSAIGALCPNELALTTTTTNNHAATTLAAMFSASGDPQRSAEAYAIRATLAHYERLELETTSLPMTGDNHEPAPSLNDLAQPWDAKHFPLSLSRYQREFVQIALLASGSFGQVFHATKKMDGCDYAIKKVDFGAKGYSNETIQEVVREVECLAKVSDHPNVVRYYTSWLEPSWMTGGQSVDNAATSPSRSPTRAQRHRPQQQPLLLRNPTNDLLQSGNLIDDGAQSYDDSSRIYHHDESASVESVEASSSGLGRQRRFFNESDVDSSDQSWESYQEQALERPTFDQEDESSLSIPFRRTRNPRTEATTQTKPTYRYQISLYIQMQLCHPASLADWIRERNSKVPDKAYEERIGPALAIFEQITKGLAHVHEKGIIHRDLKPANVFASSDGQVIKIGDFGLSKQLSNIKRTSPKGRESARTTHPSEGATDEAHRSHSEHWHNAKKGVMIAGAYSTNVLTQYNKAPKLSDPLLTAGVGTRSYAAPEQLTTKTYSTAADIFSLGLILLELVCCFETEHERLYNFQKCRQEGGVQEWLMENYPEIANVVIACTRLDPMQRPSANAVLGIISARKKDAQRASSPTVFG